MVFVLGEKEEAVERSFFAKTRRLLLYHVSNEVSLLLLSDPWKKWRGSFYSFTKVLLLFWQNSQSDTKSEPSQFWRSNSSREIWIELVWRGRGRLIQRALFSLSLSLSHSHHTSFRSNSGLPFLSPWGGQCESHSKVQPPYFMGSFHDSWIGGR